MPDNSVPAELEWERHKVVIAATVAAVVGKNAKILDVRPASPYSAWTRNGRRLAIQTSHNLANRRGAGRGLPNRGVNR